MTASTHPLPSKSAHPRERQRRPLTWRHPAPSALLMRLLGSVNRNMLLRGFAPVRWIPVIRDLPLLRGYFRVRKIDLPAAELALLRSAVNPGTAAFMGPNHPEFACD